MTVYLIFSALVGFVLLAVCLQSGSSEALTLSFLTPVISKLAGVGQYIMENLKTVYLMQFALCGVFALLVAILLRSPGRWISRSLLHVVPIFLAVLAQGFITFEKFYVGIFLYAVSAALILFVRKPFLNESCGCDGNAQKFSWYEFAGLSIFWLLICLWRLYGINQIPGVWDDELCYHKLSSVSLSAVIAQHLGLIGARSSEGLLWSFIHHIAVIFVSSTPIIDRIIAALVGLFTVQVAYFCLRYMFGRPTAFFGTVLFVFGPTEIGWARLPSLHHLPELFSFLIVWFSVRAINHKKVADFVFLGFLMACTNLLYPAGVFLFLIPLISLSCCVLFERRSWKGHMLKIIPIMLGAFCWLFTNSFLWLLQKGEFTFISPVVRHLPDALDFLVSDDSLMGAMKSILSLAGNGLWLWLHDFYFQVTNESHWAPIIAFPPRAAISSVTGVLAAIGFMISLVSIRRSRSFCLMVGLGAGLLPGLVSSFAERRVSAVFPIIIMLATSAVSFLRGELVRENKESRVLKGILPLLTVLIICWSLISQATFLLSLTPARPSSDLLADEIERNYVPSTLVVPLLHPKVQCMLASSLVDRSIMSEGKLGFVCTEDLDSRQRMLSGEFSDSLWIYGHSTLSPYVNKWRAEKRWKKVIVVSEQSEDTAIEEANLGMSYSDIRREQVSVGRDQKVIYNFLIAERARD